MKFLAIAQHTPAMCPSSNPDVFAIVGESMPKIPDLEKKHGVTNEGIHVTLGAHTMAIIMDAPSFEAAELVLLEARLLEWNTVNISQSYTPEEAMALTQQQ